MLGEKAHRRLKELEIQVSAKAPRWRLVYASGNTHTGLDVVLRTFTCGCCYTEVCVDVGVVWLVCVAH
jgi:hypothetical protein